MYDGFVSAMIKNKTHKYTYAMPNITSIFINLPHPQLLGCRHFRFFLFIKFRSSITPIGVAAWLSGQTDIEISAHPHFTTGISLKIINYDRYSE